MLTLASHAANVLETSTAGAEAMLVKDRISDAIYVFRAPYDLERWTATNSVVVINDADVTVFDSCSRAVTARAVIAEIRKLTAKPVRTLINSHWHLDHWSGNAEYAKAFPGLRIIATAQTRDYMQFTGKTFFATSAARGAAANRAALSAAIESGRLADGSPLTPEIRARKEHNVAAQEQFAVEILAEPRVLPNVAYKDAMTFWSGRREFRLTSMDGDASASTVLYLPSDKVLITGDVLVTHDDGPGPPPWTTNSYAISSWFDSLRRLAALDADAIVPGQGPVLHDKAYLQRTIELFQTIIDQVHAALGSGAVTVEEVAANVNVDRIALAYTPGATQPDKNFHDILMDLIKKTMQEARDGVRARSSAE